MTRTRRDKSTSPIGSSRIVPCHSLTDTVTIRGSDKQIQAKHDRNKIVFRLVLLQGDETRGVGSTDTGSTVLDGSAVSNKKKSAVSKLARIQFRINGKSQRLDTYYEIENSAR